MGRDGAHPLSTWVAGDTLPLAEGSFCHIPNRGKAAARRLFGLFALLNGLEVIDRSLGIFPAKAESRHAGVDGGEAVLQPLFEVGVVKLFSKRPKRGSLAERASARPTCCVTARALGFEQSLAVSLLAVKGIDDLAPGADHQECETNSVHGGSLCCRQASTGCRPTVALNARVVIIPRAAPPSPGRMVDKPLKMLDIANAENRL